MQKLCFDIQKHKNSIAAAPKTPFYLCLFSLFGVFFEAVFVIGILQKSKVLTFWTTDLGYILYHFLSITLKARPSDKTKYKL